jgi:hypothetical protein
MIDKMLKLETRSESQLLSQKSWDLQIPKTVAFS